MRLFFSAQRDPQQVLTELRLQRELHQKRLDAYQAIVAAMPHQTHAYPSLQRDQHFWQLTLDMGMRFEITYIAWLQDSICKIEAL